MQTRERTLRTGRRADFAETARQLRDSGRWSDLAAHLSRGGRRDELEPELRIMRAEAALRAGNSHDTVEIVDRLLAGPDGLPHATRAYALLVRAMASRLRGFPQRALEDASAATAILEAQTSPPELLVQGHKQIGIALASTGELDGAIDHFERALRLCARSSNLRLQAEIQNALGLTCFRLGRLPEAQVHYKNAAAAYKKLGTPTELGDVYINMGVLHFQVGEYELALEMNQQALALARAANYQRSVSMALVNIGDVHLALDQLAGAVESYEGALQSGTEALEPRLFCCANTGLGAVYRALRDSRKSRFYLDQAVYEARRLNLRHELATACLVDGELALDEGDHQKARSVLEASVETFREIGALRPLIRTYLRLGQAYLRTKRWKLLNNALEALARVSQQLDSGEQLAQEARGAREVIEYGASKRIGGPVFSSVRARLRGVPDSPRPRLQPGVGLAGETISLPRVEVRTLGGLQITVDGRKVGAFEWESQKAQEFFAFLLCNRQGKTREELIDVLWPDIALGLSRNAFHNNVYRTRRALYKACVVLEDGRYRLHPDGHFWLDLEEFRRRSTEADLTGSGDPVTRLTDANRLYRGDFLQGLNADWIVPIRMEAEGLFLGNLARLAEACASRGDSSSAIAALDRLLKIDPTEVEAQEMVVRLLVRAGNLGEARRRHEGFRQLFLEENGTEPPRDFATLCELAAAVRQAP